MEETLQFSLNVVQVKDFWEIVISDIRTKPENQLDCQNSRGCEKESALKNEGAWKKPNSLCPEESGGGREERGEASYD